MGLFERMKQAIGATKNNLVARIESALSRRETIDESLFEELEGVLLGADLGVKATTDVLDAIREQHGYGMVKTPADVRAEIRRRLLGILQAGAASGRAGEAAGQQVWMMCHGIVPMVLYLAWSWALPEVDWRELVEYPDSGKLAAMARTESQRGGGPIWTVHRLDDEVDFFDGEQPRA